jgi:hypothetical protein
MQQRKLLAVTAAIATLAMASAARAEPVMAKLAQSLAGATKPIAGGSVFECLGDVCASRSPSADAAGVRACKELARQVGSLASFGTTGKPLGAADLATCNQAARK